jgi:inosine-uridine nucleoside N-ribohydrolase
VNAPLPVVIDTDIGDDVDDAFALALALRLPQLRLVGVTTVTALAARRAQLACELLAAADALHVPVAPGAERRADGTPLPAKFTYGPDPAPPCAWPDAVELILAASHSTPNLVILGLGPLTNIAAALRRDPALAVRASLVAVGGVGGLPYPDWNLRCDPDAARFVIASGIPTTLVGLNLTIGVKLWPAALRRLLNAPDALSRRLAAYVLAWRTWKRRMPVLHDALAVAALAAPALVPRTPRRVTVLRSGVVLMRRSRLPNALVARAVDHARFDALLETALLGAPLPQHTHRWRSWLVHQVA